MENNTPLLLQGKKSGLFDLPEDIKKCSDPQHNPPSYLFIPPGKGYRHVCPTCGLTIVMVPSNVMV